jgi:hypothetical protein
MPGPFIPNYPPAGPPYVYSDLQRQLLRELMGYSRLFTSSNSIFENILNVIENEATNGSSVAPFSQSLLYLDHCLDIDFKLEVNSNLGLATQSASVKFDAYRNDRMLRGIGRNYIKKLSIIFSMKPAQDYYGQATTDLSGNIYPTSYET